MAPRRADCQGALAVGRSFSLNGWMRESEAEKKKRLAEALRTNLRRRKAQSRAGEADPPPLPVETD